MSNFFIQKHQSPLQQADDDWDSVSSAQVYRLYQHTPCAEAEFHQAPAQDLPSLLDPLRPSCPLQSDTLTQVE